MLLPAAGSSAGIPSVAGYLAAIRGPAWRRWIIGSANHLATARKIVQESIVLLKNTQVPGAAGSVCLGATTCSSWGLPCLPAHVLWQTNRQTIAERPSLWHIRYCGLGSCPPLCSPTSQPLHIPVAQSALPLARASLRRVHMVGPWADNGVYQLGSYYVSCAASCLLPLSVCLRTEQCTVGGTSWAAALLASPETTEAGCPHM